MLNERNFFYNKQNKIEKKKRLKKYLLIKHIGGKRVYLKSKYLDEKVLDLSLQPYFYQFLCFLCIH